MDDAGARHHLFENARRRAEWTIQQLWLHTVAAGGTLTAFDIEAYLSGLVPLAPTQQDLIAATLNDRLSDLYEAAKLPYLTIPNVPRPPTGDALAVIDDLLGSAPHPSAHTG